jgi:glycyl-tRNA synthetase alpha chain
MYLQNVDNVYDIVWNENELGVTTYGDVHKQSEYEFSKYNFEVADTDMLFKHFDEYASECKKALDAKLPLPAYDYCLLASHTFNVLDARKAVSVTNRQNYILKVRELAKGCAETYKEVISENS